MEIRRTEAFSRRQSSVPHNRRLLRPRIERDRCRRRGVRLIAVEVESDGSQGCPTRIFAPEVVVVQTRCGLVGITGEKTLLMADLMGLGYDQAIQMPYDNNGSLVPLQVRGRDFILTMDVDPLDLSFGDWEPGSFSNMNGAGLIDMDADGRLDLLVTARRGSEARYGYLRNVTRATPRLPADLNDDGRVDGADLGELFVQWTG